jgi:hypothetical protein
MQIEFVAFAGDCWVRGTVDLPEGARLSDFLNEAEEIPVRGAELVSHTDGHVVLLDELSLRREDLYAVVALEPRSPGTKRLHTVRHRLEVRSGPYTMLGYLHARPGALPLFSLGRRLSLVPLTGATIAFSHAGSVEARDVETLIVNRDLADWVRADPEEMRAFHGEPAIARGA